MLGRRDAWRLAEDVELGQGVVGIQKNW